MKKRNVTLKVTVVGLESYVGAKCLEDLIGERVHGLIDSNNLTADHIEVTTVTK